MPRELPGAGYHPYLEVPWDTLKFSSNSRRACIKIPVSRAGQGRVGRGERNMIAPRSFKFNFKRVNNIKSFDYPARILAQSSNVLYVAVYIVVVIRTTLRHVSPKIGREDEYRIRVLKAPEQQEEDEIA